MGEIAKRKKSVTTCPGLPYCRILPPLSSTAFRLVVLRQNMLIGKEVEINYLLGKHPVNLFCRSTYKWPG